MGRNEITVEIYERDELYFSQSTISTAIIIFDAKTYDPKFSMISPEGKKSGFFAVGQEDGRHTSVQANPHFT